MTTDETHAYRARAVRSGDWWAITVPELGGLFSQAKRLDQVEAMAREAIAMMLDIETDEVGRIDVDVVPPAHVAGLLNTMQDALATAGAATEAAASARREAARLLREDGLPVRDVGRLIGVSHQRVSQILAG